MNSGSTDVFDVLSENFDFSKKIAIIVRENFLSMLCDLHDQVDEDGINQGTSSFSMVVEDVYILGEVVFDFIQPRHPLIVLLKFNVITLDEFLDYINAVENRSILKNGCSFSVCDISVQKYKQPSIC